MKFNVLIGIVVSLILFPAFANCSEGIGFKTVDEALSALKIKVGVSVSVQGGWTIVEDSEKGNMVLWSFTPSSHPAHPAAVKRTVIEKDKHKHIYIQMKALCQASKVECDSLIAEFEALNKKIQGSL